MKISIITDFYGNDLTYIENELAKQYTKFGFEVFIICSVTDNPFDFYSHNYYEGKKSSIEVHDGIKIYRQPYKLNIKKRIKSFEDVYNILCSEKPDFIFFNGVHLNLRDAARYKKKKECKIILYSETDYSNSAQNWLSLNILHKVIWKAVLNQYKKNIYKIFFATPASSKFLKEVYDVPFNEAELLPLGCDCNISDDIINTVDRDAVRNKLNIGSNDYVLITGGKLEIRKMTEIAIEAVKILNRKDVHLIVFGAPANGSEEYFRELEKSAYGHQIHFTGWLSSDMFYQYMAISDVAVFPASQSVLWQQAIGMHLPLIAGDAGEQDMSYLNFNENIIKIDKDNIVPIKFAETIEQLISIPGQLNKMKKGAEKTAKENLSYEIIARKAIGNPIS
ncbi:glycosyltransferase family 4 protein [Chryseobacterium sp. OSA05B]|uniref:glycosyltransferase family 4 protein n=1 Tax=Chryseobacterium sp. OSA05B TaxID=2862650 RepID=UPI001CBB9921|nr:glycosyltransferase family 4 protein [Chryseobacterium sp. OSA05B]